MFLTDLNLGIITNLYKILFLWFISFALGRLLSSPIPYFPTLPPPSPSPKGTGKGREIGKERVRDKVFLF